MKKIFFTLFLIFPFLIVYPQDTIHVPEDYSTIQEGINAANNGNIVLVEDGVYTENINFRGKAITVASHFIIDGDTNHISNTIIDGSQPNNPDSGSVVTFNSGEDTTSMLCGFTITGGTGTYDPYPARAGGGIACYNSGAKILHNIIVDNHIVSDAFITTGGGINGGFPGDTSWIVIENNTIINNSVTSTTAAGQALGGGIDLVANARVINNIIKSNTVQSNNTTAWGGGVSLGYMGGQPVVQYCIGNTIWNNKAISPNGTSGDGGVAGGLCVVGTPEAVIRLNDIRYNEVESNTSLNIDCWGGGVMLQNQTSKTIFSQNYVAFNKGINNSFCKGAGVTVWNYDVTGGPQIINNIITDNSGGTWGGGLFLGGLVFNNATLINNTISNNSATLGGAVYVGHNASYPGNPIILNSIMWNNSSSIYVTPNSSVTVQYSDIQGGWTGTGNIDSDPLFIDTTFCLSDLSPCIGTGKDSIDINGTWYYSPPYDFDGDPRPNPSECIPDIGAQESPKCDTTTNINEIHLEIPKEFSLSQNYPNPFNPSTTVRYSIPILSFVTLKVYDVLGNELATLVKEEKHVGVYEVEFSTRSGLASGIYFYQLKAGSYVETKKMILLK